MRATRNLSSSSSRRAPESQRARSRRERADCADERAVIGRFGGTARELAAAIPDLVNAGLYGLEGDGVNAAISAGAAIQTRRPRKGATMAHDEINAVVKHGDEAAGVAKLTGDELAESQKSFDELPTRPVVKPDSPAGQYNAG